jgi:hypothetical protein
MSSKTGDFNLLSLVYTEDTDGAKNESTARVFVEHKKD